MAECPRPDKRAHESQGAAWEEARGTRARYAGDDVKPYLCRCGKWHVGHSRKSFEKRVTWMRKYRPPLPGQKRKRS